jgi:hypothetical protein
MGNGWYPQVIGTAKGETDKQVGHSGRFFMSGYSTREITFRRADDPVK